MKIGESKLHERIVRLATKHGLDKSAQFDQLSLFLVEVTELAWKKVEDTDLRARDLGWQCGVGLLYARLEQHIAEAHYPKEVQVYMDEIKDYAHKVYDEQFNKLNTDNHEEK